MFDRQRIKSDTSPVNQRLPQFATLKLWLACTRPTDRSWGRNHVISVVNSRDRVLGRGEGGSTHPSQNMHVARHGFQRRPTPAILRHDQEGIAH
jgi:hypothetical protein